AERTGQRREMRREYLTGAKLTEEGRRPIREAAGSLDDSRRRHRPRGSVRAKRRCGAKDSIAVLLPSRTRCAKVPEGNAGPVWSHARRHPRENFRATPGNKQPPGSQPGSTAPTSGSKRRASGLKRGGYQIARDRFFFFWPLRFFGRQPCSRSNS